MAELLEQTKNAIAGLRASGLKRGEYQVRTPLLQRGRRGEHYGDAQVCLWASRKRQLEAAPELAKYFDITVWCRGLDARLVTVATYNSPGIEYRDLNTEEGRRLTPEEIAQVTAS